MLFARSHPSRCAGMILLSAVTKRIPVRELKRTSQHLLAFPRLGISLDGWRWLDALQPETDDEGMLAPSERELLNNR